MKNIILIIISFLAFQANAQTVHPVEEDYKYAGVNNIYFQDVNHLFDKFLGTWECTNGADYLKIVITKVIKEDDGLSSTGRRTNKIIQYFDYIKVDYLYKHNGVTVYNTIPIRPGYWTPSQPVTVIRGGDIDRNDNNLITLYYEELSTTTCFRARTGQLKLTYQAGSTPQLKWKRTDKPTGVPDTPCETGVYDYSEYKIPANLILNKVI